MCITSPSRLLSQCHPCSAISDIALSRWHRVSSPFCNSVVLLRICPLSVQNHRDIRGHILLWIDWIDVIPGPLSNFVVFHVNMNSIMAPDKLSEVEQFVSSNDIDVLALWDKTRRKWPMPLHFEWLSGSICKTPGRLGGGVALYGRSTLPAKRWTEFESPDEELIWMVVKVNKLIQIIGGVYVPHNLPVSRHDLSVTYLTRSVR